MSATCQHDSMMGWDYNTCSKCGWVNPDMQHKRGTSAKWNDWFPSMDAFAHFKRTGIRSWLTEKRETELEICLRQLAETVEAAIASGDWKADGACDPERTLTWARQLLGKEQVGDLAA